MLSLTLSRARTCVRHGNSEQLVAVLRLVPEWPQNHKVDFPLQTPLGFSVHTPSRGTVGTAQAGVKDSKTDSKMTPKNDSLVFDAPLRIALHLVPSQQVCELRVWRSIAFA